MMTPEVQYRPTPEPNTARWLLAIVVLSAVVHLVHFAAIAQSAFIDFPIHARQTDMYGYWQWSETIIAGDWLGRDTYHPYFAWMAELGDMETWYRWWGGKEVFQQEPAYPYLLAIGRALGMSLGGIILAQLLVGSLQPLLIFWLGRLLFNQDKAALIAALIAALYAPLIFNQGALLRDWLAPMIETLGLVALLYAVKSDRQLPWICPGMVFGVALMTKSTIMIFIPLMIGWMAWVSRSRLSLVARKTGFLIGGLVLGFAPLAIRNLMVGVAPFQITNRLPPGIVVGNAADASPLLLVYPESLPVILEQAQGSAVVAAIESLRSYQGDWVAFLKLQLLKFRAVLDPFEMPNNLSYAYGQEISPILRWLPDFGWVFPLCVLGLGLVVAARRCNHRHGLMLMFGFSTIVGMVAIVVVGRYRLALAPFLFVYAGWALWQLAQWTMQQRYRAVAWSCLGLVLVAAAQHRVLPVNSSTTSAYLQIHRLSYEAASAIYLHRKRPDLALEQWARMQDRAAKLELADMVDLAVREQQSLGLQMATAMAGSGRVEQAAEQLRIVDQLFEHRLDKSYRDFDLGMAYWQQNRAADALVYLQRFLRNHPDRPEAVQAGEVLKKIRPETFKEP